MGRLGRRDNGTVRVPSSDHVNLAVHEFGGDGPPLLLSHATGFHGYAYLPIADALERRFTSYAVDCAGTATAHAPGEDASAADATGQMATRSPRALVAPEGGLTGFGHSMGGTALLMAAHRDPDLFDTIVVYEPIIFDPSPRPARSARVPTRRRRTPTAPFVRFVRGRDRQLPVETADEHVRSRGRPPLRGTRLRIGPRGVRLKCDPEHEARTFENGALHRVWDLLPDISTRVVVATGIVEDTGPSAVASSIAERLPNAMYVEIPDTEPLRTLRRPGADGEPHRRSGRHRLTATADPQIPGTPVRRMAPDAVPPRDGVGAASTAAIRTS